MSWPLWLMLQWTWECRYLFEWVISFRYIPRVGLLDHMVFPYTLWGMYILFSIVAVSIYISTNNEKWLTFVHILNSIRSGMRWHLTVVLTCISGMISDAEHHFMYLLAICMLLLKKSLCKSFSLAKSLSILLIFWKKPTLSFIDLLYCLSSFYFRYFCSNLEARVKDREASCAAALGIAKSWTHLSDWTRTNPEYLLCAKLGFSPFSSSLRCNIRFLFEIFLIS